MCLAIPGRLESIDAGSGIRMGQVNFGGVVQHVCLACVPELVVGDYALVHAGFAICRVDEQAARETLQTFADLAQLNEPDGPSINPGAAGSGDSPA